MFHSMWHKSRRFCQYGKRYEPMNCRDIPGIVPPFARP